MIQIGAILRDDAQRPVKVLRLVENGHKVELERQDRKPREHRTVTRFAAVVSHYADLLPSLQLGVCALMGLALVWDAIRGLL